MEAAIRSLSETLTGFLGVDATGAVTDEDDDELGTAWAPHT